MFQQYMPYAFSEHGLLMLSRLEQVWNRLARHDNQIAVILEHLDNGIAMENFNHDFW